MGAYAPNSQSFLSFAFFRSPDYVWRINAMMLSVSGRASASMLVACRMPLAW
jgi:hypothetical protein